MSVYRAAHKRDASLRYFWGAKLWFQSPLLLTNAPWDVSYGGETYAHAWFFEIPALGQSVSIPLEASVTIGNLDGSYGTLIAGLTGSQRTVRVEIWEWWFSATTDDQTIQETIKLGDGRMDAPSWTDEKLTFRLGPFVLANAVKLPAHAYSPVCGWPEYRGPGCEATASPATYPTCSRDLAACTARSNVPRFGGFPHVPGEGTVITYGDAASFVFNPRPENR